MSVGPTGSVGSLGSETTGMVGDTSCSISELASELPSEPSTELASELTGTRIAVPLIMRLAVAGTGNERNSDGKAAVVSNELYSTPRTKKRPIGGSCPALYSSTFDPCPGPSWNTALNFVPPKTNGDQPSGY